MSECEVEEGAKEGREVPSSPSDGCMMGVTSSVFALLACVHVVCLAAAVAASVRE